MRIYFLITDLIAMSTMSPYNFLIATPTKPPLVETTVIPEMSTASSGEFVGKLHTIEKGTVLNQCISSSNFIKLGL